MTGDDVTRRRMVRRPRTADELESGPAPQQVGEALQQLVKHLGWGPRTAAVSVIADWERIVGPAIAAHAGAISSDGRTLVVGVDDPAWATELRWLEADLLDRLRSETGVAFERLVVRVRAR